MRHSYPIVLAIGLLFAGIAPAPAQMVRMPIGGGGPNIGPIGGGFGGVGSGPSLPGHNVTTLPDLRGSLPHIETPKINDALRAAPSAGGIGHSPSRTSDGSHSSTSTNNASSNGTSTTSTMTNAATASVPSDESTIDDSAWEARAVRGVNLNPKDPPKPEEKDKDDDEEGGSRWWIWLIVVAVVYVVARRKD